MIGLILDMDIRAATVAGMRRNAPRDWAHGTTAAKEQHAGLEILPAIHSGSNPLGRRCGGGVTAPATRMNVSGGFRAERLELAGRRQPDAGAGNHLGPDKPTTGIRNPLSGIVIPLPFPQGLGFRAEFAGVIAVKGFHHSTGKPALRGVIDQHLHPRHLL